MARPQPSPSLKTFLSRLATTVANASEDRARGEAIVALAQRLIKLPDEAFTEACMSAALDGGHAATLGADVAYQRITRWWETNRPRRPGEIPREVEASNLSAEAKRWAAYWIGRVETGALAPAIRLALSLVRSQSPDAFDWLVHNHTDAAIAARYAGWTTSAARQAIARRDWRDPAKIELAIQSCHGFHHDDRRSDPAAFMNPRSTLRALVSRWAPENLALLEPPPPEPEPPTAAPFSIFGGDVPPAITPSSTLSNRALADAYAKVGTPAGQFRAAQLGRNDDPSDADHG